MTMTTKFPQPSSQAKNANPLHQALLKDYSQELFTQMESLSISAREAVYRGNLVLAAIHFDQMRLVGKEIGVTLKSIDGGAK
jgi:hypothetical protein